MISANSPLSAAPFTEMPRISAGRHSYVPVQRNQVLYSHFKYVSGIAAAKGQHGISIDKLRILNAIIDQLVNMKTNEKQRAELAKSAEAEMQGEVTEKQLDSLLTFYHNEIKNAMAQTEAVGYGGTPEIAAALDLTA